MEKTFKSVKKLVIFIAGVSVFTLGLFLIPLPGPGILVCFIGLLILATEFEWAARHRDRTKHHLHKLAKKAKNNNRPKRK